MRIKKNKNHPPNLKESIMVHKNRPRCPLFPENVCPQGEKSSNACKIRINGEFDPVAYFKDLLVMHCAIKIRQRQKENRLKIR
jgi:hypothetical protein